MNVQRELPLVAGTRGFVPTASKAYAEFRRDGTRSAADALERVRTEAYEAHATLTQPDFLLSRVWSVPGRLHPRFRAGVLEAGALANLLVLDPTHPSIWPGRDVVRALALSDTSEAIDKMMLLGRWVHRPGALVTHDGAYREAREEASRRLELHLARIGR